MRLETLAFSAYRFASFSSPSLSRTHVIYLFPDILVNAGGVTVSYFEWVQNRSGLYWTLDEVNQRLKHRIVEESESIWFIAHDHAIDLRTAAYVHALTRLGEAISAKGIAVAAKLRTMGSRRGVGALPPARGGTPAPRPNQTGCSYTRDYYLNSH